MPDARPGEVAGLILIGAVVMYTALWLVAGIAIGIGLAR